LIGTFVPIRFSVRMDVSLYILSVFVRCVYVYRAIVRGMRYTR